MVCSYSEQTYTEKVYLFSFREGARSKPQIFKVVRQEWPSEQQSVSIKVLKTAFSFYGAVSGAMAFPWLCTMCGTEDFIKVTQGNQVQAALCQTALVSCI